ncbi:MAG: hypothetical protein R2697_17535 [Ilumatobacteraceae bacterium]
MALGGGRDVRPGHGTAPRLQDRYVVEAALAAANGPLVPDEVSEAFTAFRRHVEG